MEVAWRDRDREPFDGVALVAAVVAGALLCVISMAIQFALIAMLASGQGLEAFLNSLAWGALATCVVNLVVSLFASKPTRAWHWFWRGYGATALLAASLWVITFLAEVRW
ncbi:MAG: hypothetical protein AAGD14_18010 [Planctomycetota bacterium]